MGKEKNTQPDEIMEDGVHNFTAEEKYITPPPPIKEKLEEFKDLKLGFMIHWGLYNQLGIVPSWGMVDNQKHWSRSEEEFGPGANWSKDGNVIREDYFNLINSFNPVRFDPKEWADLADENCFKYLIFTTKHHDGFCMWDTKQTDYKVTSQKCPYHTNEKADIVKYVFDAFREKGMPIAAYFSKPDFHSEDFWESDAWHKNGTTWEPTYDINEKPEKWQAFIDFTHKQLEELVRDYGKVDILWLDGAIATEMLGHDINLGKIVEKLRKINPELIVADRCAGTEHENYLTPELEIPEDVIHIPWESCMTLGVGFQYVYDDDYKSPSEVINMLLEIVCKGGNLALNISPQPDGRMPKNAIKTIRVMGEWLKKYGEGIFKTRPCAPYRKDHFFFTQTKDHVYVFAKNFDGDLIPYCEKINEIEIMNTKSKTSFSQDECGIRLKAPFTTTEEFTVFKLNKEKKEIL